MGGAGGSREESGPRLRLRGEVRPSLPISAPAPVGALRRAGAGPGRREGMGPGTGAEAGRPGRGRVRGGGRGGAPGRARGLDAGEGWARGRRLRRGAGEAGRPGLYLPARGGSELDREAAGDWRGRSPAVQRKRG